MVCLSSRLKWTRDTSLLSTEEINGCTRMLTFTVIAERKFSELSGKLKENIIMGFTERQENVRV